MSGESPYFCLPPLCHLFPSVFLLPLTKPKLQPPNKYFAVALDWRWRKWHSPADRREWLPEESLTRK